MSDSGQDEVPMVEEQFTLGDDFPAVSYEAWREAVEGDLKGAPFDRKLVSRTLDGLEIQPLYTAGDWPSAGDPSGLAGLPPFTRGGRVLGGAIDGWDVRSEHSAGDAEALRKAIARDLAGGATSISIRLDSPSYRGSGAEGAGGSGIACLDDLDAALTDVDLSKTATALEAGGSFLPASAILVALWRRRGIEASLARGAFNADPLAALAAEGALPVAVDVALDQMADLAAWTSAHWPGVTAVAVSTAPYHDAGATAAQDLAISMATAIAYLRAMEQAGLGINIAARQMLFSYRVGCNLFQAIAKLRAARRLWARIIQASGGGVESRAMTMHVRMADRVLTQRDPWVNMLRNTIGCFAAAVAGADVITTVPFDAALGEADAFSARVARNTQLVLREEANLHRVIDPAGGAWFIEHLTDDLAAKAWSLLREIEASGGMIEALAGGLVAGWIDEAHAARLKAIAKRKDAITGVSEFPNLGEEAIRKKPPGDVAARGSRSESAVDPNVLKAVTEAAQQRDREGGALMAAIADAAEAGASIQELTSALADGPGSSGGAGGATLDLLPLRTSAAPFEALRDASDAHLAASGSRPRVFLANMGPIAQHTARATWSKNFFEAGGIEAVTNDGFADASAAAEAFNASGAQLAVICSSDELYETIVEQVALTLKAAGAREVILAGRPGEHEQRYRAAGVDRFIFLGCDVLATLTELLAKEAVRS